MEQVPSEYGNYPRDCLYGDGSASQVAGHLVSRFLRDESTGKKSCGHYDILMDGASFPHT